MTPAENRELMVDKEEREKILTAVFSSCTPLRMRVYPPKLKKKLAVLRLWAEQFAPNRRYRQEEVNALLGEVWFAPVTLRRDLIDLGFLSRENDGSAYWRSEFTANK